MERQHGFYFNSDRCVQCHACEVACKSWNEHIQLSRKGELNMLNRLVNKVWILGFLLIAATPVWAQRGQGQGMKGMGNSEMCLALINSIPKQALDSTEAAGLAYLREEEKLAHDVYATLNSKWGLRVFGNISQSEDRHFSAIKLLLSIRTAGSSSRSACLSSIMKVSRYSIEI